MGLVLGWVIIVARDEGLTTYSIPVTSIVWIMVLAFVMGIIAAVIPAWRARIESRRHRCRRVSRARECATVAAMSAGSRARPLPEVGNRRQAVFTVRHAPPGFADTLSDYGEAVWRET